MGWRASVAFMGVAASALAQPVRVADQTPGGELPRIGSYPAEFAAAGTRVFFTAQTASNGRELFVTQGTAATTVFLREFEAGLGAVSLGARAYAGSTFFFVHVRYTAPGFELWKSDGTAAGTQLVRRFASPLTDGGTAAPDSMAAVGAQVVFDAVDPVNGRELWVSDGTFAGTHLLTDIYPGAASSNLFGITAGPGGVAYFQACTAPFPQQDCELWKTDGVTTARVADLRPGLLGTGPIRFTSNGTYMFFVGTPPDGGTVGRELWRTDGTPAGTVFYDVRPGDIGAEPIDLVPVGSMLYFRSSNPADGGLFRTDGTAAPVLVPGPPVFPRPLAAFGNQLLLSGQVPGNNLMRFWLSDGATTRLLHTPDGGGGIDFAFLGARELGASLLFSFHGPNFGALDEVWVTDGGPPTLLSATPYTFQGRPPYGLGATSQFVIFPGESDAGIEPTAVFAGAGLALVADLGRQQPSTFDPTSSALDSMVPLGTGALFTTLNEVFFSSGFAAGQLRGNGRYVLKASTGDFAVAAEGNLREARRIPADGGIAGLVSLETVDQDDVPSLYGPATAANGTVFFTGSTTMSLDTPRRVVGVGVVHLCPGPSLGLTAASAYCPWNGGVAWAAPGRVPGDPGELYGWTPAGGCTGLGTTAEPPPTELAAIGDVIIYHDTDSAGVEPWRSNGSTRARLGDLEPGPASSFPTDFTRVGGVVYFVAESPDAGRELWRTDGVTVELAADVLPGVLSSTPHKLAAVGGALYFSATDSQGTGGWRIYPDAGLTKLFDGVPGPMGSDPGPYVQLTTGPVVFPMTDSSFDRELWRYQADLTPPVVVTQVNGDAGLNGWFVSDVSVSFSASDPETPLRLEGCAGVTWQQQGITTAPCVAWSEGGATVATRDLKRDTIAPAVQCPGGLSKPAQADGGVPVTWVDATATDNLTDAGITYSVPNGSVLPRGMNIITATGTDEAGNFGTCIFLVDVTAPGTPDLTCPMDVLVEAGGEMTPVSWPAAVVVDDDPSPTVVYSKTSGSSFPVGMTRVDVSATDRDGLAARCSFQVVVRDTKAPVVSCPAMQSAEADGPMGHRFPAFVSTAIDLADPMVTVTYAPSTDVFPLGTTPVTATASDDSGNQAQCTFQVEVHDTRAPTLSCPMARLKVDQGEHNGDDVLRQLAVRDPDGVDATPLVDATPALAGAMLEPGVVMVTVQASDHSGNVAPACAFEVEVCAAGRCVASPTAPHSHFAFGCSASGGGLGLLAIAVAVLLCRRRQCTLN